MPVEPRVTVAMSPLHSAFMLVTDALFGARTVAPHAQDQLVRQIASRAPVGAAFGPVVTSGFRAVPDVAMPTVDGTDPSVDDHVDRLTSSHDAVIAEFTEWADAAGSHGGSGCHRRDECLPPAWRHVADDPDPWLAAMVGFSRAAWDVLAPLWGAARPLLDQEIARVGSAVVRGMSPPVLNALSPRITFADDAITIDGRAETTTALRGRDVVLVPMLAGDATVVLQRELPDVVQLGYPLPGGSALVAGRPGAVGAEPRRAHSLAGGLAALMGDRRAAILNHLDRPRSMGDLANALDIAPATATHHCDYLESAGLVERVRSGRSMLVGRSARAEAVLDVLRATG